MRYVEVRKAAAQNLRGLDALAKRERERPTSTICLVFSQRIHSIGEHEDKRLGG
jgi:hypothetical protein